MTLKGNEAIKAGAYINLARGANAGLVAGYYAVTVAQGLPAVPALHNVGSIRARHGIYPAGCSARMAPICRR
jgi:hypothetical protein